MNVAASGESMYLNDDLSDWNIYSIVNYIKENLFQFLLLLTVFFIIYIVDYLNNLNAALGNLSATVPGLSNINNQIQQHTMLKKTIKKQRKK
jgi:hypothetical protein